MRRPLRAGGAAAALAFVSGSPVQMAPRIARFLERNGFPPAALYLRNLGPDTLSGYKQPVLARLADRFPQPLVLVGDPGEKDPEIYAEFAASHPRPVLAAFIRQATPAPGPRARFAAMRLFADPGEAGGEAAALGLADPAYVAAALGGRDGGAGAPQARPDAPRPRP